MILITYFNKKEIIELKNALKTFNLLCSVHLPAIFLLTLLQLLFKLLTKRYLFLNINFRIFLPLGGDIAYFDNILNLHVNSFNFQWG